MRNSFSFAGHSIHCYAYIPMKLCIVMIRWSNRTRIITCIGAHGNSCILEIRSVMKVHAPFFNVTSTRIVFSL